MNQEVINGLIKIMEILVIPFCLWVIKLVTEIRRDISEVRTVLIGPDGKNGIRSRTIRNENRINNIAITMAAHGMVVPEHISES